MHDEIKVLKDHFVFGLGHEASNQISSFFNQIIIHSTITQNMVYDKLFIDILNKFCKINSWVTHCE